MEQCSHPCAVYLLSWWCSHPCAVHLLSRWCSHPCAVHLLSRWCSHPCAVYIIQVVFTLMCCASVIKVVFTSMCCMSVVQVVFTSMCCVSVIQVELFVNLASFQDHLFLLNHVLRCPAGVASWAAGFVQIAAPPTVKSSQLSLHSPALDHIVTCLATIMSPIRCVCATSDLSSVLSLNIYPQIATCLKTVVGGKQGDRPCGNICSEKSCANDIVRRKGGSHTVKVIPATCTCWG